ncbi:MAG: NTP transferase domain-containing protein, partial [Candidatus Poribacteria bacterium]|nr:NTP transferase domain-containing protein [Candidatus Poribacteria bacterium]
MMRRAIVLAAGEGRKIWPYGEFRQKCTLPVANVAAVRRICRSLREIGVTEIAVVVGHHGQQVKGATADIDGVRFVTQTRLDGTATAAYAAHETFSGAGDSFGDTLIVYGDIVTPTETFRRFAESFAASGAEAGALVQPLGREDASNWIVAGFHNGRLGGEIKGHSRGGSHRLCGMYALKPSAFTYLLRNPGFATRVDVGGMPPPEAEIAGSFQVMLDDGRDVFAMEPTEFLVDLDKPWHILEANEKMRDYLCARIDKEVIGDGAEISDDAEISGKLIVGKNTRIGKRVIVTNNAIIGANCDITNGAMLKGRLVIGDRCRISDYCEVGESVIGNRCVIGHGAEFSGVLFDKVYLYHYCEMSGVFGEATDIGAATVCGTLRFDDGDAPQKINGRTEIPPTGASETYMGDFTRTGVNTIFMPGVKVG